MKVYFSKQYNPESWPKVHIIRFPFNIEKFCLWVRKLRVFMDGLKL